MADVGNLTRANAVMKIVGTKWRKQYEEMPLIYNRLSDGKGTKISDRGLEIPSGMTPNPAHTFVTDGGNMPVGGSPGSERAQVFFKNQVHSAKMSGAAIDSVNGGDVAYVENYLQHVLSETVKTHAKFCNIYAYGTGNARLAALSATATSATMTVNNNDANRYLRDGLVVDIINTTTGVAEQTAKIIENSSPTATTFTFTASTTGTTPNIIVAAGAYNLAPTGLRAIIDDTTNGPVLFQGISRNQYTKYRASRVDANAAGLDVSHLRRLLGAGIHIAKGELNRGELELLSHPAQWSAYNALGWQLKRIEGKSKSFDLGFTGAEYEGINWITDVDCQKDVVYAANWSTLFRVKAKDPGWDEKTGAILRQVPSSTAGQYTDQYEAYYTHRYNYGCYIPNSNGFVDELAVPTGF